MAASPNSHPSTSLRNSLYLPRKVSSAKTFSLPQSTRLMEQVEQVSREPEIVQAETELPHHLWNVCFQGRQQNRVQGGHTAKASKSVDCLSTVYPELITCRADLPPTTRTRFHSVLQQGGALPLVQQAAEQQLSVQEGCEVPLLQSRGHLERE